MAIMEAESGNLVWFSSKANLQMIKLDCEIWGKLKQTA